MRVLYDYKPTSKSAIPLKRGEYIVVMPVRTESSNSHSESNRSASENPNGPMWIAGSKITGETGYFPSSFVELIKLECGSPKKSINTNSSTVNAKATPNKKAPKFTSKRDAKTINTRKRIRSAKKPIKVNRKPSIETMTSKKNIQRKGPRSKKKQSGIARIQINRLRTPAEKSASSVMGSVEKEMESRSDVKGKNSNVDERHKQTESPLNKVLSSKFDDAKSNVHSLEARSLMENHIIAWIKQCVEVSIYALDRTYLNLALHACKKYNLIDISEEKCLEKLEVEDELNYMLTRSFFKNCRDLRATMDKIKLVVEKGKNVSQAAFEFMSKGSFRMQRARQFLEFFNDSSDLSSMQLLCECASFMNVICNDPGGRTNDNLRKEELLYHILRNGEYGDKILDNKQFMPHLTWIQKLCRMMSPCALLFAHKTLRGERDNDTEEMESEYLISSYLPVWDFQTCKVLLRRILQILSGDVAIHLRKMLDYGRTKSRNISKHQKLALQRSIPTIVKDIHTALKDVHRIVPSEEENRMQLSKILQRPPQFNKTLYKTNEKVLLLIERVVYFEQYKSIF